MVSYQFSTSHMIFIELKSENLSSLYLSYSHKFNKSKSSSQIETFLFQNIKKNYAV